MAKPNIKVTGLAMKRSGSSFIATWKVPADATKSSNTRKWSKIQVTMYAKIWKNQKSVKAFSKTVSVSTSTKTCTLNLSSHLAEIFPLGTPGLLSVTAEVCGTNASGKGPVAAATFTLSKPAKPSVGISYDAEQHKVTVSVTAVNSTTDTTCRYDHILTLKKTGSGGDAVYANKSASTLTSRSYTATISNAGALPAGEWMKVTATVQNRGWRTSSDAVVKSVYIAHPSVPSCGTPVLKYATEGVLSTASVLVPITSSGAVKADATIYPSTLFLQRLRNSTASTATEASAASGWENVSGATATGTCTGLMDTYSDAVSTAGKRTWFRVVAQRDGYTQYGVPVFASCIAVPASGGSVGDATIGTVTGGRGGALVVPVSWTQSSNDGAELSWSVHEDAWQSNEEPEVLDITWASGTSATATIRGLETGVPVYIRARCYSETDGSYTYGNYSETVMAIPYDVPSEVTATVPATVETGSEIPVMWSYDSSAMQAWADVCVDGVPLASSGTGHTVEGSAGAAAIPAQDAGSHSVTVLVSIDGVTSISSSPLAVLVVDPPSGTMSASTLEAQPLEVSLSTAAPSPTLLLSVVANGTAADEIRPAQPEGEVVWSGVFSGETLPGSSGSYTATLPTGLDFRDGSGYTVRASLEDGETGLSADLEPVSVLVDWNHQAVAPDGAVEASAEALSATVTVEAPSGAAETDVLDLYRITPGGQYLIASGREFGMAIEDPLAPYRSARNDTDLRYRAVTRTVDGDVEFSDIPYVLDGNAIRLDWADSSVELLCDVENSDEFEKDFEARVHADGSAGGLWSSAVEHKGSLSTAMVKLSSAAQRESVVEMARHTGPVFVRTPDGMAYPANVDLSMETSYNSVLIGVSLEATEVGMADEFMAEPVIEE